ncbi:MAG: hypothetical protein AAGD96_30280, partial [Chloroflexota bacterium]
WFTSTILAIVGYVAVAWLILRYRPNWLPRPASALNNKLGESALYGILLMIFVPIGIFIAAMFTGFFFGFGGAFALGAASFATLALISLASPILIGYWLGNRFTESGTTGILIAVAAVAFLITLPLVGWIFSIISYILVLGSFYLLRQNDQEPPAEKVVAI